MSKSSTVITPAQAPAQSSGVHYLRASYLLALGAIATLTLLSQVYIQRVLKLQSFDAEIINRAGQQRMLSQELAKFVLLTQSGADQGQQQNWQQKIRSTIGTLEESHCEIQSRYTNVPNNGAKIIAENLSTLGNFVEELKSASEHILNSEFPDDSRTWVEQILNTEAKFLPLMNQTVGLMAKEAEQHVRSLQWTERTLFILVMCALVIEAVFVFEPAARRIKEQFSELKEVKERLESEFAALNHASARVELSPSGKILHVNDKFMAGTSLDHGDVIGNNFSDLLERPDSIKNSFWQELEEIESCRMRYEFKAIGDTPQYMEIAYFPVRENNRIKKILVYCLNISEQVETEREKKILNIELRKMARQSGMVEATSGLIHNVGNILNNISVSSGLVSTQLKKLPIQNFQKIAAELDRAPDELAEFLTNSPRGKKFPEYLLRVSEQLGSVQQIIQNETDSLRQRIGHVKEIVAQHHSLAKGDSDMETLLVTDLIDDTIRLCGVEWQQNSVELNLELDAEMTVYSCRHQVLQILVNLLRNAKQAAQAIGRQPSIVIRSETSEENLVSISVEDNGIGIPKENLGKMFKFGFTTKKNGNGFGLHSSRTIAEKLGGRLAVTSQGKGLGAEFQLFLPTQPNESLTKPAEETSSISTLNALPIEPTEAALYPTS